MTNVRKALAGGFNGSGDGGGGKTDRGYAIFFLSQESKIPHSAIIRRCLPDPHPILRIPITSEEQKRAHLLMLRHQTANNHWTQIQIDEVEELLDPENGNAVFKKVFDDFTDGKTFEEWKSGISVVTPETGEVASLKRTLDA